MSVVPDLEGPMMPSPDGSPPNFENPPNNNALALGVLITCTIIPTIAVLIRVYQKSIVPRKIQIEEVLTVIAYGVFWGAQYSAFVFVGDPGYYVNTWNIKLKKAADVQYWMLMMGICYATVMPIIKTAIMIEWCRMFVPRGQKKTSPFYWGSVALIVIQNVAGAAFVILLNVRCQPYESLYDAMVVGNCHFDLTQLQIGSGAVQLGCDIIMFLLPQPVIWRLKMDWQKRLGVSIIFGLGLLACVSAAFRLAATVSYIDSVDPMYDLAPFVFWVAAEQTCGFFIIVIPCMPKFLKETGIVALFRRAAGLPTLGKSNSNLNYYGKSQGPSVHGNTTSTTTKDYYKLDEEGTQLRDLGTESTENLRKDPIVSNKSMAITRTQQVVITQETNSDSDSHSHEMRGKAWGRY